MAEVAATVETNRDNHERYLQVHNTLCVSECVLLCVFSHQDVVEDLSDSETTRSVVMEQGPHCLLIHAESKRYTTA